MTDGEGAVRLHVDAVAVAEGVGLVVGLADAVAEADALAEAVGFDVGVAPALVPDVVPDEPVRWVGAAVVLGAVGPGVAGATRGGVLADDDCHAKATVWPGLTDSQSTPQFA